MTLEDYIPMVKFIASVLGEDCEVVLHDVRNPENSILAIENNHISGRQVGGVLTDFVLKTVQNKSYRNQDFISNYVVVAKNNRVCQSSSYFIKNDNGEIIGTLCINIDISSMLSTKNFLDKFIRIKPPKELKNMLGSTEDQKVSDGPQGAGALEQLPAGSEKASNGPEEAEILEHLLETSGDVVELLIGKVLDGVSIPVERMCQEEKIEVVRKLNELGLFMFKGGVSELAKRLKVSEATVYRYLHKIREEDERS